MDLELPAQVIGVFGPNGAGKSTLMESIGVALYGVGAARTKKKEIRTHGLLTDTEIRMVFEHGGQQYEVRRRLKGRGATPEAELFGGGLLLAAGVGEVDEEVQRLLHMDLGVFRASAFAEQKQLDAFSDVTASKRKEMALRLLGIRPVDEARKVARAEARAAKQTAEQLSGAMGDLAALQGELKEATDLAEEAAALAEAALAELETAAAAAIEAAAAFEASDADRQRVEKLTVRIVGATTERSRLDEDRSRLTEAIEQLRTRLDALPALEAELAGLEGAADRLRAAQTLADLGGKLVTARGELEALPHAVADDEPDLADAEAADAAAADRAARAAADRDAAAATLEAAQRRVARAGEADPSAPCPTCGQPLGSGFAAYVRHAKAEAAEAKRAVAAVDTELRAAERDRTGAARALASVRGVMEEHRAAGERRRRLQERVSELEAEWEPAAAPFDGAPPDLDAATASVDRERILHGEVAALRAERAHLDASEAQLGSFTARQAELAEQLDELTREADGLCFDQDDFERLRLTRGEADARVEAARAREREAGGRHAQAEKERSRLQGRLEEAQETERKVADLRSDERYLDRTVLLLDGFRDHLVGRVGPELSREAEALFRELTNREYDDLKIDEETLAIQIADGDTYFPVERFSGSESDLANLALRVAISTHLSRVSGADLGILILDEVLGSLDQERKDLMVRTMGRLSGRFHQLFVITHAEQVKDQFPASIQVTKLARRRSAAVVV